MKNKIICTKFKLSNIEIKKIKEKKTHYLHARAAVIEALKIVQKKRGWVCLESMNEISKLLGISVSEVEEVATFYSNIYRQPVGRNIIRYCDSMVCYITGYLDIKNKIEQILGIKKGETTIDNKFTLLPACCLGYCDKSPVLMINDDTYYNITIDVLPKLLDSYQ
jgi:NADH-quinone oxidoreductase subunit E